MDEVTGGTKDYRFGEEKPFRVRIREASGADLSALTGTLTIYDDDETTELLSAGSMSLSLYARNTEAVLSYAVTVRAAGTLTAAGNYPAVVKWTLGTTIRKKRFLIRVKAVGAA